ncbi:hypothetical protein H6CHR_03064 [Variovorax sp. PBL-H6]|uniref:hypothetical protein n=1 Tax=Variovorax sp. PBL-H6 TaxID=434009 RepID=UPI0013161179|nr:hypothetical protein [Variovorax sp. PBL-H6]VTU28797.1 hypothetical protein H6CHR_03064 [Variovorax sp. PBL-H6]
MSTSLNTDVGRESTVVMPTVKSGASVSSAATSSLWKQFTDIYDQIETASALDQTPSLTEHATSSVERADPRTLYPHYYDQTLPSNASFAIEHLKLAIKDMDSAVEAYANAQMGELWAALGIVAGSLNRAHAYTSFNEALGAVVSYAAQALNAPHYDTLNRDSLMAMQRCLYALVETPTMSLSDAADSVDDLEQAGWDGNDRSVSKFAHDLLAYFGLASPAITSESAAASAQSELEV